MKTAVKILCVILSILMAVTLFAACKKPTGGETEPASSTDNTEAVTDATEATEEATDETTAEPVSRPTADGQLVEAYDITFYLPEFLTANSYNGMLGVYDFYTGEYITSRPSGMDVALSVTADSNVESTLAEYAAEHVKNRLGAEVEAVETELNGFTWLKYTVSDGACAYFAIFNEGLYEIYAERGGDTQENYDAAIAMMEQTLFLAVVEY